VDDVGVSPGQARHTERVLERFQRQAQPRTSEGARAPGVEHLAPLVAVGHRSLPEAEARGEQLDVDSCARKAGGQLVVVLWRERGGIAEDDAHDA